VSVKAALELPQRAIGVGAQLSLLILGTSPLGLTGVDLTSGALVRAAVEVAGLTPLDVVETELDHEQDPDPTQPESVRLAPIARVVDHLHPKRAERWLRPLLHPTNNHLLGFAGPAVPFWELDGTRPSVALVGAPGEVVADRHGLPRCRFEWRGLMHDLPVNARHGARLPRYAARVLVALTPPIDGHCYKVVSGLL
jgi:hypothetical protein